MPKKQRWFHKLELTEPEQAVVVAQEVHATVEKVTVYRPKNLACKPQFVGRQRGRLVGRPEIILNAIVTGAWDLSNGVTEPAIYENGGQLPFRFNALPCSNSRL